MRIDVEVYKGPLSHEPEVQMASLIGAIEETHRGLVETVNLGRATIANEGFGKIEVISEDEEDPPYDWPLPRLHDRDDRSAVAKEVDAVLVRIAREVDPDKGPTAAQRTALRRALARISQDQHDTLCSHIQPDAWWWGTQTDYFNCALLLTLDVDLLHVVDKVSALKAKYSPWFTEKKAGSEPPSTPSEPITARQDTATDSGTSGASSGEEGRSEELQVMTAPTSEGPSEERAPTHAGMAARGAQHDREPATIRAASAAPCPGTADLTYDPDCVRQFLMEVSELAEILRLKAFRWAIGSTAGLSSEFKVRIAVVASIVATSEYGNQLKVRADALMKQFARETGRDRRELPPAVALREAEPTDFTRLYKWFDAATYNWVAKHIEGIGSVEDRVNVVERLFGDNFWARINTVYASGRGEARMAFVKDDVGNWNLKSFDNDPEELLKAYTRFTKVALQKAAEITAAAATGGSSQAAAALVNQMSSVNQLMSLANQSGLPGGREARAAPVAEVVAGLHERVADKLHKRAQRCAAEEKSIPDEDGNATAEKKVTQRLKCLEALGEILRSHSEVLDTTVKSLLPTSQTNPPDVETLKAASVPPKSP